VVECWNSGTRLGVFLVFSTLLDHLHRHHPTAIRQYALQLLAISLGTACVLAGLGWAVQKHWPTMAQPGNAQADVPIVYAELPGKIDMAMRGSRPVLLGSRDPSGPSCVIPAKRGEIKEAVPPSPGDLNGGPGTTMAALYTFDRAGNNRAMLDFDWHQKRLKSYLENEVQQNEAVASDAHALAESAREFAEQVQTWTSIPEGIHPTGYNRQETWPSYCMTALDQAITSHDVAGAKHWSGELAVACFSLDDLHQWLSLVVENHLAALAFQKQCQTLFESTDKLIPQYQPNSSISAFPAGVLSLNGWGNYAEIERQAEKLYSMPPERVAELKLNQNLTDGSLWVFPGVRASFLKLREALSPANQQTWDQAARTPYEHSYLISMLYRAVQGDAVDSLVDVLKRFDQVQPKATVGQLMSVIMYRGHSFAGLEWSDRYIPQLIEAANKIPAGDSDLAALMAACKWTNQFYGGPQEYGVTLTLREALDQHKLDCVRATDMIGAIFRDAGRTRFGHVRWCAGTAGHSVAAYLGAENNQPKTSLVDGLNPPAEPETFPDCYFHGHKWPAGMEDRPTPYCVELYLRGIDNYLWAEGYIIRGPNAGWHTTAAIPYSTRRKQASVKKVFDGPYPE
jgi:hypothetical protein